MVMLGAPLGVQQDHRDSLSFLEQAHYVSSTINVRLAARYGALHMKPADAGLLSPDVGRRNSTWSKLPRSSAFGCQPLY